MPIVIIRYSLPPLLTLYVHLWSLLFQEYKISPYEGSLGQKSYAAYNGN